jgi:hypothetical protein
MQLLFNGDSMMIPWFGCGLLALTWARQPNYRQFNTIHITFLGVNMLDIYTYNLITDT